MIQYHDDPQINDHHHHHHHDKASLDRHVYDHYHHRHNHHSDNPHDPHDHQDNLNPHIYMIILIIDQ